MASPEMQAEVRIVAEAVAKPGKAEALRAVLLAMVPPSVAEAGCRQYELHEDRDESTRFFFVERWADAAAFDFHCATPHFRQLGPAIEGLIAAPPRLSKLRVIG